MSELEVQLAGSAGSQGVLAVHSRLCAEAALFCTPLSGACLG